MKIITSITLMSLISISAFSETASQQIAKEMIAVLQSQEIQSLLSKKEGVGGFEGIKFKFLNKAVFGPSQYEVSFKSYSASGIQTCKVLVDVNINTMKVMGLTQATCQEVQ